MTTSVVEEVSADFDSFYHANFGNTVAMTYGLTADLPEAHDIAQEAFCRAWSRWPRLSSFDNPAAWVRRVAVNLARSRWRRLRAAADYLVRQRPATAPELDPDHVAVVSALRKLPATQREALVLHYIVDLPLTEIAEQFEVPLGTVKSWLHRGRTAMAADLRIDVSEAIDPPGTAEVFKTIKKRQRVRRSAAAVILTVLVVGVAALVRGTMQGPPQQPAQSPSPSPNVTPSPVDDPMRGVDWSNATIVLPDLPRCPSGSVRLHPTESLAVTHGYPQAMINQDLVAVGDLDGDGDTEAVLPIFCLAAADSEAHDRLIVVERHRDGTLHATGGRMERPQLAGYIWIDSGIIYVSGIPMHKGPDPLGVVEGWRWTGSTLEPVDTSSRYPRVDVLNLTPVQDRMPCPQVPGVMRGQPPRAGTDEGSLEVTSDPPYRFHDLGRAGRPYLLVAIECGLVRGDRLKSVVIFDQVGGEWLARDVLRTHSMLQVVGDRVRVDSTPGTAETFTFDGQLFQRAG